MPTSRHFNAFISYSHAADGKLAPAIQQALSQFARPWNKIRALRVFRDETNLSVNPSLWSSIESALDDSSYFLLLASPEAAASKWVRREIDRWISLGRQKQLYIIVTEGEVVWDPAAQDFDWKATTAVPEDLRRVFADEPLYLDLRWARKEEQLSLRHPQFRDQVAGIAAEIRGRSKDELTGEDVREHKKFLIFRRSMTVGLAFLTVLAGAFGVLSQRNARNANRQRGLVLAQALATEATRLQGYESGEQGRAAALALQGYALHQQYGGTRLQVIEDALRDVLTSGYFSVRLPAPGGAIAAIATSADGKLVAAGGRDSVVRVWDLEGRRAVGVFPHRSTLIRSLAIDSHQHTLVAGTDEGQLLFWNLASPGGSPTIISAGDSTVKFLALIGGGEFLVAAGPDTVLRVWNARDPKAAPRMLCCHAGGIHAMAVALDGTKLAAASARGVLLWNPLDSASQPRLLSTSSHEITSLSFSPSGKFLAATTRAREQMTLLKMMATLADEGRKADAQPTQSPGEVVVWNLTRQTASPQRVGKHNGSASAVAFGVDETELISAGDDQEIKVWKLAPGRQDSTVTLKGHRSHIVALIMTRDRTLISAGADDGELRIWQFGEPLAAARSVSVGAAALTRVAFSPTGSTIAASGLTGVFLWNWPDMKQKALGGVEPELAGIAFAHNSRWLAIGSGTISGHDPNNAVRLYDSSDYQRPRVIERSFGSPVGLLAFNRDGSLLAAAGALDDRVMLWRLGDTLTLEREIPLKGHVSAMAFHPSQDVLGWATSQGTIGLWRLSAPTRLDTLPLGHSSDVVGLAFDSAGSRLLTAGLDSTVRIWPMGVSQGRPTIVRGLEGVMTSMAVDPAGTVVATGNNDHTVTLWSINNLNARPTVLHVGQPVYAVAFSLDGRWVAAVGAQGSLTVWPRLPALIEIACRLVWSDTLLTNDWRYFAGAEDKQQSMCVPRSDQRMRR